MFDFNLMLNQDRGGDFLERLFPALAFGSIAAFLLCVAYIGLVPTFSPIPSLGSYNEKRVLQIGILILVGGILLGSMSARKQWLSVFLELPGVARWGSVAVLGLGSLSAVLTPASFYAFLEVGHYVLLFAVAGAVTAAVHFAPRWSQRILVGAVVAGVVLYVVHFTVGYGMYLKIPDIKIWPNGGTNFANTRFFNHYQTWTLPLLGGVASALPSHWRVLRGGVVGLISVWWTLIFASAAQGTVVAMGVATFGVGLLFQERSSKWIGVQIVGALIGWVLYEILFTGGSGETTSILGDQLSGDHPYRRLDHWVVCVEMVKTNPLLGVGPMHYAWPPFQFTEPASPHSLPMRFLAEWGIVATGILGSIGAWAGYRWIKQELLREKSGTHDPLAVALVATALVGTAHSMVSGLFVAPLSQVLFAVVGGWIWGRYLNHRDRPANQELYSPPLYTHVLLCGILVAAMGIVGSSLGDISTAEERRETFVEAKGGRFSPRYWQQGYIGLRDSSMVRRADRSR